MASDGICRVAYDETLTLTLERVDVEAVHRLHKERFNCNNIWPDQQKPDDYEVQQHQNTTSTWIDQFHRAYGVCNLDGHEQRWMYRAWLIGRTTGRFPLQYIDELEALLTRHAAVTRQHFDAGRLHFVRTEGVSLKSGMHGVGPYRDLRSIIESIVTSRQGHAPLDRCDPEAPAPLKIYLLPWIEMVRDQEFRVFVCNREITCISQQALYCPNIVLQSLASEEERIIRMRHWCNALLIEFNSHIRDKMLPRKDYSLDLTILPDGSVYFIEVNCFGETSAAGSALFHWVIDRAQMLGHQGGVHARFVY